MFFIEYVNCGFDCEQIESVNLLCFKFFCHTKLLLSHAVSRLTFIRLRFSHTKNTIKIEMSSDSSVLSDVGAEEPVSGQRKKKAKGNYRKISFSAEDEEKLIELVKGNPLLYSPSNPEYKDKVLRGKAWDGIGKSLSKSSEECKKKWKNIKDQYDRTRKKVPTGSGNSASQNKRKEVLSFLDSCVAVKTKYV